MAPVKKPKNKKGNEVKLHNPSFSEVYNTYNARAHGEYVPTQRWEVQHANIYREAIAHFNKHSKSRRLMGRKKGKDIMTLSDLLKSYEEVVSKGTFSTVGMYGAISTASLSSMGQLSMVNFQTGVMTYNKDGIRVVEKRGGWSTIQRDGYADFSVRSNDVRAELAKKRKKAEYHWQNLYHTHITTTKKGMYRATRNHVNGMLKTAIAKGRVEDQKILREVLDLSDEKMKEWYDKWVEARDKFQIEQWYDYNEMTEDDIDAYLEGYL